MREVQEEHESKLVLDIFTAIFSEIVGQGETRPRKVTQNDRKKGKKARHDARNNVEMETETTTRTGTDRDTPRRCEVVSIERPAPMQHPLALFPAPQPSSTFSSTL